LSYAELATAHSEEGGDYVYLGRAYGKWAGFLFGWAQMAIVRPGDIAVMAFALATYGCSIWDPLAGTIFPYGHHVYAIASTVALTLINVLGVKAGTRTQNLLTTVKAAGLLLIVAIACITPSKPIHSETAGPLPFSLALIFVMFAYGGWNEMAYVAAEVKNPARNIVRTLVVGLGAVMIIYLLVNSAFLYALGYHGLTSSEAVAVDTVKKAAPHLAGNLIAGLICISALGALNGLIFAGARISYAMGADHLIFRLLGNWNPRFETPAAALLLQGTIAVTLIILLGSFVNAVLYTAATVYSFYLATTMSIFILRRKEPDALRPYRVTGYPLTPIIFAGMCVLLVYSAVAYKPLVALISFGLLLLGLPLWLLSNRMGIKSSRT